ncbi:Mbov_0392 family ICE element protein [Mycoplasmopsis cynos]|uniref:Mbov_0392 family ICE element protein n=1 Tax=Mycoplasmopsis cynos TaxID=171284 RepID=UPI0030D0FD2D
MNNEEELIFFDEMELNNPSETKNETKFELKDIFYLTQYYNIDEFENYNDYLDYLNKKLSRYDESEREDVKNCIINIIDNMTDIDDKYNEIISNNLNKKTYDKTSLENIKKFTEELSQGYLSSYYYNDIGINVEIDDKLIHTKELIELVDNDLKINGLESKYIYLIDKLDSVKDYEYVKINDYVNDFSAKYLDLDTYYKEYFKKDYKRIINDYFELNTQTIGKGLLEEYKVVNYNNNSTEESKTKKQLAFEKAI